MSSNETDARVIQFLGRVAFSLAVLFTIVLVIMGITGAHWPKWLLALTTIL
jgi:type IV secretory pathway VirB2 component (pilin)